MIDRAEIDETAKQLAVHTSDVQRDYVFGWLLNGIFTQSELGRRLVLKGGNCLRKGYFPFGRFSSDLDFSTHGGLAEQYVIDELNRVCGFVQERAGVTFDTSRTLARPKRSADDDLQIIEARLYFKNFYGEESEMRISVRMDITEFDRLYLPIQSRRLIHAYSDQQDCQADIRCVKLEEQLASKLKCLLQRRHVADFFDFVYCTLIHPDFAVNRSEILNTFLQKTIFRGSPGVAKGLFVELPIKVFSDLWTRHIVCPIASRIDFGAAAAAFGQLIETVFGTVTVSQRQGEFFPAALRNPIMEAGHTMTLLSVTYHGVRRQVEPYSLAYKRRKDGIGREYFYVYDRTGGSSGPGMKALVASGVQHIENTDEKFEPRLPVEITKAGELNGPLHFEAQRRSRGDSLFSHSRPANSAVRKTRPRRYTLECGICGKRFYRDTYSTRLNAHKDTYGNRCIGRTGHMV